MKRGRFLVPGLSVWTRVILLAWIGACATSVQAQQGRMTTELALDVRSPQVAAMTEDGMRIVVTASSRRGRLDTDHGRYGDPTYVAPSTVSAMVIDTRTGARTWLHEAPAQVSDFTWSADGRRLAYLLYDGAAFRLRLHETAS
ncbi:MAG: hypothetical protein OEN00_16600, partial [Gemmatimonadota bacterium]|nr:hypothetical protein [Gemmatimonadota bacterium]